MNVFATLEDIELLFRPLNDSEIKKAEALIPVVSASLRTEARKVGKDLDNMVADDEDLRAVAKSVTVDVVARTLMTSTDSEPMTQISESGMGYSFSGTYLTPGGGIFIKRSELARLGLKSQKYGVIDIC